jgi:hypothetical protein
MRYQLLLLAAIQLLAASAHSQLLNLTGENYLLLNGERFKNQKVSFKKAEGEWFVKGSDTHGDVTMITPYEGREIRFNLEWDSADETITNEVRHQMRKGEFYISMQDKDVYGDGLTTAPEDDDEIRVLVTKIDDVSVSLKLTGTVTEANEKVKVEGLLNLGRAPAKKIMSGMYKDCDNVLYDRIPGAEDRSTTDCEKKFDLDVKSKFSQAFEKVLTNLQEQHWQIKSITEVKPSETVHRGSEKFMTYLGEYTVELQLDPSSQEGQAWYKKNQDIMDEIKDNASNANYKPDNNRYMKAMYEVRNNTNIVIIVSVNSEQGGIGDYTNQHKVLQVPGAAYAQQASYSQARSGGGIDNSQDRTVVFFGRWKPGKTIVDSDGGSSTQVDGYFDKAASHLSVQNIRLQIEASPLLANQILKDLDLQKLMSALN